MVGGGFIQPNRASLANVTRKGWALATAMRWLSASRNPVLSKLFAPPYCNPDENTCNNLRHSGEANRIINRAVAWWVLFAHPIAKLHGAKRESGLVVVRATWKQQIAEPTGSATVRRRRSRRVAME